MRVAAPMARQQMLITVLATMEEGARAFYPSATSVPVDLNNLLVNEGWHIVSINQMTPVSSPSGTGRPMLGCSVIIEKNEG